MFSHADLVESSFPIRFYKPVTQFEISLGKMVFSSL